MKENEKEIKKEITKLKSKGTLNQKTEIRKAKFISTLGNPVAYYPRIARAIRSVNAGIFICQLLYWHGKGKKGEWTYKSRKELTKETGLSREQQDGARKLLKKLNILEEKLAGIPATTHYKIDFDRFDEIVGTYLIEKEKAKKEEARKK